MSRALLLRFLFCQASEATCRSPLLLTEPSMRLCEPCPLDIAMYQSLSLPLTHKASTFGCEAFEGC